ncbi:MAG: hypothetical protein AB7K24_26840 [Gemmataceae bacterium]
MTASATPVVSRFEANLLTILRFLLRKVPEEQALPLLLKGYPRPKCLSRACVQLVEDTLAKGSMLFLARGSGWRHERYLRGDKIVAGRLWERTPPEELGLHFSGSTLEFLIWLTETELPSSKDETPELPANTSGDWLLLHLAFAVLRQTAIGPMLRTRRGVAANPLCRLAFPSYFGTARIHPDFDGWTAGTEACILESMQQELRTSWRDVELAKAEAEVRVVRGLGQSQEKLLTALFDALERAGRFDLARFFLQAMADVLADDKAYQWVGNLTTTGLRLADRAALYRTALAPVVLLERLHQWEQQARNIGYFDEGYAAAQLFKVDWETQAGDTLMPRAHELLRRWGAWQSASPSSPGGSSSPIPPGERGTSPP